MARYCNCWECEGSGYTRRQEIKHGGVTEEELPRKGPRKKTRKWCRGKIGVKHRYTVQFPYSWSPDSGVEICDYCGKHGKYLWSPW